MKDGIYNDLNIRDYHSNASHTSSTPLKMAYKSLKNYKYYVDGKMFKESFSMDFGNAFELALLDSKGFENEVAIMQCEAWKSEALEHKKLKNPAISKYYQDKKKDFLSENEGKYIIKDTGTHSYEAIEEMLTSCKSDAVINRLTSNIQYQTSILWTDKTGLKLKTRPDICRLNKNVIVDVKTTRDGSPEHFSKDLVKYNMPLQAVMQMDGVISSGYMPTVEAYYWLVVETEAPYCATLYRFDQSDWDWIQDIYEYLKGLILKALKEGLFPGYTQRADNDWGVLTARIPSYYGNI